ncbi:MAG: 3-isopropylmalate dehydratase small subunit [Victivallales bacterium]|nr:3-isopropylmalate dehydratase small subunit [Victivallales bacterium]
MKKFEGKVLFLDRSDINTDEIIPAKYLTEISKEALKPHLLEDLKIEGFAPDKDVKDKGVIVTKTNFGCGSSREHAPWSLEVNNINVVIAESFARIFRQNMYNCGMLAIELPEETINKIFNKYSRKETYIKVDIENSVINIAAEGEQEEIKFSLKGFDRDLILAGGWVDYVDKKY